MLKPKLLAVCFVGAVSVACSTNPSQNGTANTGTGAPGQPRNSVDVVKATAHKLELKPGEDGETLVQLDIQKGYHVNANPPTFSYLKATELEIPKTPGLSVSFIVYPDAITKSFPFAEKPLAIYEGTISIKARLKAERAAQKGSQNIPAKLKVQACDDQVCYAPGTLDVNIPLDIK